MQLSSASTGDRQGKAIKRVSFTEDHKIHTFSRDHYVSSSFENININCPNDDLNDADVLLGKGKRAINHVGNLKLKYIVNMHKEGYEMLNKPEKTMLCRSIIQSIRNKGGRFLILDSDTGMYEEAPDCLAHEKVSHHLRAKNKKPSRRKQKSRIQSRISRQAVQTSSSTSEHFVDIGILKNLLVSQRTNFVQMLTNEPSLADEIEIEI